MYVQLTSTNFTKCFQAPTWRAPKHLSVCRSFQSREQVVKMPYFLRETGGQSKIALLPHVLCVPQRTILKADHGKMFHIGKPGPLQYPTPLPSVWPSVDRICAPVWPTPYSSSGAFLDPPGQHLYSIALMIVWLLYKHPSLWLCISYTH